MSFSRPAPLVAADGQPSKLSSEAAGAKMDGVCARFRSGRLGGHEGSNSEQAVTNSSFLSPARGPHSLKAGARESISHDEVLELLDYDAETGIFIWKSRGESASERPWANKIWNKRFAGKRAGAVVAGYRRITLFCVAYRANRLAWFYVHGVWPADLIDHINHVTDDDRISNLREVNNTENHRNRKPHRHNKSGVPGVRYEGHTRKWIALISINGKRKNLGRFYSFDAAKKARRNAEVANGYHPNHGAAI